MQNIIQNIDAEQAVLGSILLEGDLIKEVSLSPEHLSHPQHRVIFQAMRDVEKLGEPVDLVTIVTKLGDAVESVGGVDYLSRLAASIPSTANIEAYQRLIFESYRLREMQRLSFDFANEPTEEKITAMYQKINELQELGVTNTRTKQDILYEIYNDMHEEKGEITGIDTGFEDLNKMTGGWQNGDLIILAARPSMGKTALLLNFVMNNCSKGGVADIFSLEMPDKQLVHRMLSAIGNINGSKWRNPRKYFSENDFTAATEAIGDYESWTINIHDQAKQTIADIRAAIRRTKRDNPGKKHIVAIDYLQLISIVGKFERNDLAIGYITRELKQMARAFDVPIILLSQLSRAVEQRQDKRPMMSDLRDSGSIEQDADIIMFLYRDDYYNKESEKKNIVEVNLAKHRNGPTGSIELLFRKEYGKFLDLTRQMEANLSE
jgi:replicative DNA helicase